MLNDSREIAFGIDELKRVSGLYFDKYLARGLDPHLVEIMRLAIDNASSRMSSNDVYILCASKNPDELSQWRGYGGRAGYAIGIDVKNGFDDPLKILTDGAEPIYSLVNNIQPRWMSVAYSPFEQGRLLVHLMRFLREFFESKPLPSGAPDEIDLLHAVGVITTVLAYIKNPGFQAEQEVRAAFTFDPARLDVVKLRTNPIGLCPYVKVAVAEQSAKKSGPNSLTATEATGLPISKIIVGPGREQDFAERGVRRALEVYGYSNVQVEKSVIPFRA
ncbi:DUF2971 domain-containing protein [Kribbella qitaiheensis]|uniref:DUF2971 domain-containing protein n=1 Tax=Kribbella qitaiheensis TaxID=1544730 RepID=A0A7G6WY17_9ACTN|nr:DUF2971 domain-containing protein [Kribbella qitaiheensis]QNE18882.1 DUF2971 domain-containing protein [Kribbella qitaiheensis]